MGIAGIRHRPERQLLGGNRVALPGSRGRLARELCRGGRYLTEQLLEPVLIQQHLLVGCPPEGADLLLLAPGGKGRGSHTQRQERFEMLGFGAGEPLFPVLDRSARDPEERGQALLGQPDGGPQSHKGVGELVVTLAVLIGKGHGCALFFCSLEAMQCEVELPVELPWTPSDLSSICRYT